MLDRALVIEGKKKMVNLSILTDNRCTNCMKWQYWPFYYIGQWVAEESGPALDFNCNRCVFMDTEERKKFDNQIKLIRKIHTDVSI